MAGHDASRWRAQRQQTNENHSVRFLDFALGYAGQTAADLDAVERELANLLAGMDQAYTAQRFDDVIDYASILCRPESGCLGVRGYRSELRNYLGLAVTAARQRGRFGDEAVFHHSLAVLALNQGKVDVVKEEIQIALDQFSQLQDTKGLARSQGLLATLYRLQGNYRQARQELEKLLGYFESLEDKASLAVTYSQLGRLAEVDAASLSTDLFNLAMLYESLGKSEKALGLIERSVINARDYKLPQFEKRQQTLIETKRKLNHR